MTMIIRRKPHSLIRLRISARPLAVCRMVTGRAGLPYSFTRLWIEYHEFCDEVRLSIPRLEVRSFFR